MGFSGEIYSIKRMGKEQTLDDARIVNSYFGWFNSEWSREHYKTFEEYCKQWVDTSSRYREPKQEEIDFYSDKLVDNFGHKTIETTHVSWCSSGLQVQQDLIDKEFFIPIKSGEEYSDSYTLSSDVDKIDEIIEFVSKQLEATAPKEVYISKAMRFKEDEELGEVETYFDVDAVEFKENNGASHTVLVNDSYGYDDIVLITNEDDYSHHYIYEELLKFLNWYRDNKEDYICYYCGGW